MANWSNPTLTSTYSNFLADLKARDEDLAKQFDGQTVSNLVTGAIRWNSSINRWQKWDGTSWGELASTYALTALSTTGAASIGGALTVTGAAALNGGATTTTAATGDNSTTIATTAFVKAQAYATLASPALTGTPTVPTAAAGTNTTQAASTAFVNSAISGIGIQRPATGVLSFSTSNGEVFRATAADGLALGSTAANANVGFRHAKSITGGTTAWAQYIDGTIQTDVTTSAIGIGTSIGTAASTALTTLVHYQAAANTFGAGTTVTNQIGFSASSTLSGATNDYGFYGALAAATGAWNCYMVGTAANYFAGQVQLGAGSVGTPSLATNGDTDSGIYFPASGQVGVVTNGALAALFDDSGDLSIYNSAGTFSHKFSGQPSANRTITLPDADVTLVSGTMVPTGGTGATGTWGISISGGIESTQASLGYSVSGVNIEYVGQGGPQVRSQGGGAAMMSFHRPGAYAINFGLGSDNQLRTGGWSRGGNYVILDSGNYTGYAPSLTGSGANGTWSINVTGSSGSCSGNAATATKLSTAGGSAPSYSARAWVNFNGTGTVSIRNSGNVSSIGDNGIGDYWVNFSTAMPSADHAAVVNCGASGAGAAYGTAGSGVGGSVTTSSAVRVNARNTNGGLADAGFAMVSVFS